ncbi:MAG: hypothetical protein KIT11_06455 [Fimbriimonadaceae bacterium]|nr:hypothetical protein [Fimbriimonadaceae bacterium]QYK55998.1 MAG: hypothetical protein KF733_00645 [Fimbriimonadaceae bacterium]
MKHLTLTVGLLAALASNALGQARLTGFQTNKAGGSLEIAVQGQGLQKPKVYRLLQDTSYILEFTGAMEGRKQFETVGHHHIKDIQLNWYSARPPKVRLRVRTTSLAKVDLVNRGGQWIVRVTPPNGESGEGQTPQDLFGSVSEPINAAPQTTSDELEQLPDPFAQASDADRIALEEATRKLQENAAETVAAKGPKPALAESAPSPSPSLDANTGVSAQQAMRQRVSLDFVGTDVVQILKALSIQAGVNIIAAPEVSPQDKPLRVTLSLNDVQLEDALSMLTSITGLRYAKVGNTFVVTPGASFTTAMRQIMERNADSYQTRVINLISGEGAQIRDAALKALPPDGRNGYYEIIVPGQAAAQANGPGQKAPTDGGNPSTADQLAAAMGQGGAAPNPPQKGQEAPASNDSPRNGRTRAFYLMLVGDTTRLSVVEQYIRDLDARIAQSFSLNMADTAGTVVVPIQSGETQRIKQMIDRLLVDNPRASDYSISETSVKELPEGELATHMLLMIGPAEELETLKKFTVALDQELCRASGIAYLDSVNDLNRVYEVIDLKYLEPMVAEFDLKNRIRGLWVTVVPDPVTPGITGEDESKKADTPQESAPGGGGSTAKPDEAKLKRQIGREPMKLVLRGTRQQISQAKAYLAMIDVAPRQVALELRVMEMTKEDALKIGLDWSLVTGARGNVIRINQGLGDNIANPGSFQGNVNFDQALNGVTNAPFFENGSFLGTLDQVANNRNLIARPNALVSDGRSTDLFVGDTVRYIKSIQTSQNGTTVITDQIKVGVVFGIKARIGSGGNIALDLKQNFSILTGFTPVPGGGQLPQTSDRETSMFVNMRSGETIALGGLIMDQDRKSVSGIPILKDIPIIGQLFSRRNDSKVRTEIVFFLTAMEVTGKDRAMAASPETSMERSPRPLEDYKESRKEAEQRGLEERAKRKGESAPPRVGG